MIRIPERVFEEMTAHVKGGYPDECCGALLGKSERAEDGSDVNNVTDAVALTNIIEERSADRYKVDPVEILKVEKEASKMGVSVVGFYHSHPDHPDEPSEFDREEATWPGYSYVIIAVENGEKIKTRSWMIADMEAPFEEEELSVFKAL